MGKRKRSGRTVGLAEAQRSESVAANVVMTKTIQQQHTGLAYRSGHPVSMELLSEVQLDQQNCPVLPTLTPMKCCRTPEGRKQRWEKKKGRPQVHKITEPDSKAGRAQLYEEEHIQQGKEECQPVEIIKEVPANSHRDVIWQNAVGAKVHLNCH
jgi:hypothetical protein